GRSYGSTQEIQPLSAGGLLVREHRAKGSEKRRPLPRFAAIVNVLRAVGVVHVEQRALREGIGTALVVGVVGVTVDLDGAKGIALDQKRDRSGSKRESSSEIDRTPQDQILGSLDVGIDLLFGLLGAPSEPGKSHGRAHQLEEAAA